MVGEFGAAGNTLHVDAPLFFFMTRLFYWKQWWFVNDEKEKSGRKAFLPDWFLLHTENCHAGGIQRQLTGLVQ